MLYNTYARSIRFIYFFALSSLIAETFGFYFLKISVNEKLNDLNFNVYTFLEIGLIALFFKENFHKLYLGNFILFFSSLLLIFNLYLTINWGSEIISNKSFWLIIGIYHTFLSLFYFYQAIIQHIDAFREPAFWVSFGLLAFYGCGFLLTGFINYLVKIDLLLARQVYSLNHFLNIILYSSITYSFVLEWKRKKSY